MHSCERRCVKPEASIQESPNPNPKSMLLCQVQLQAVAREIACEHITPSNGIIQGCLADARLATLPNSPPLSDELHRRLPAQVLRLDQRLLQRDLILGTATSRD